MEVTLRFQALALGMFTVLTVGCGSTEDPRAGPTGESKLMQGFNPAASGDGEICLVLPVVIST